MAKQQFAYALVIVMLAIGQVVNCDLPAGFERCDNNDADLQSFSVSGCEGGPPCKMRLGQPVNLSIKFATTFSYRQIDVHIDVNNDNSAHRYCSKCLTLMNEARYVSSSIYPVKSLPNALESDTMKFYLTNGKSTLICVKFAVEIEGGKKESDFVDHLEGKFELRMPGGKRIPKDLAEKIAGRQTTWPNGKKLPKELANELAGTQVTFTF